MSQVTDAANPATATAANAKALLSMLGVVRVTGADAGEFLNAQFTADLKRLPPGCGGLAAWCSPKGRVLFLIDVLNADDDGWLLLAPRDEVPALVKRLRLYVLRAKVEVDDASMRWGVIGLAGEAVPATLSDVGRGVHVAELRLWRVSAAPALAYACGPQDAIERLWNGIDALIVDAAQWDGFEIDAARPRIAGPLVDRFLPQEIDLERQQGLHFDKGCYPGQEVIARLKYRGQMKSGLRRAHTDGPVAPGDRLYRPGASASVGDVLRVAPRAAGGYTLLTVLDFAAAGGPLRLRDAEGPSVHLDS